VTGNLFRPPLPLASCIISFSFAPSCVSTPSDTSGLSAAFLGAAFAQDATDPSASLALTGEALMAGQSQSRIFIQFAGYKRDYVIKIAAMLSQSGWRVAGAERGGERVTTAAGLNEVRYFNPADMALAAALKDALQAEMPGKDIKLQDLSATRYGTAETSLMEIWISE
jgi:hypothetical protein